MENMDIFSLIDFTVYSKSGLKSDGFLYILFYFIAISIYFPMVDKWHMFTYGVCSLITVSQKRRILKYAILVYSHFEVIFPYLIMKGK